MKKGARKPHWTKRLHPRCIILSDSPQILKLAERCRQAMESRDHQPKIQLVVPEGWKAPRSFPRRELDCVNSRGEAVFTIRADKLFWWLDGRGLIKIRKKKPPKSPPRA